MKGEETSGWLRVYLEVLGIRVVDDFRESLLDAGSVDSTRVKERAVVHFPTFVSDDTVFLEGGRRSD